MSQQGPHGNITDKEINNIKRTIQGRALLNSVNNIIYQRQFCVGDILVVRRMNGLNNGKLIEEAEGIPERYQVVYKDGAELVYVKRILKGGKLGQKVDMIATWNYDSHRFEPDPERMESILMDQEGDYDPYAKAKDLKKKQDRQRRANQKIRLRFDNLADAEKYIRTLSVGSSIYSGYSLIDNLPIEREIISVEIKPLASAQKRTFRDDYDPDKEWKDAGYYDKCVVTVLRKGTNQPFIPSTMSAADLCNSYSHYYDKKPFNLSEV